MPAYRRAKSYRRARKVPYRKRARPSKTFTKKVKSVVNRVAETKHCNIYPTTISAMSSNGLYGFSPFQWGPQIGAGNSQREGARVEMKSIDFLFNVSSNMPNDVIKFRIVGFKNAQIQNGTDLSWYSPLFNPFEIGNVVDRTDAFLENGRGYTRVFDKVRYLRPCNGGGKTFTTIKWTMKMNSNIRWDEVDTFQQLGSRFYLCCTASTDGTPTSAGVCTMTSQMRFNYKDL